MSHAHFAFIFVFVLQPVRDRAACSILDTYVGSLRGNVARAARPLIDSRRSLRVLQLLCVVTCTRRPRRAGEGGRNMLCRCPRRYAYSSAVRNLSGMCECVLELLGSLEQMKTSGARAVICITVHGVPSECNCLI